MKVDTIVNPTGDGARLVFTVDEGRRLAISGVDVVGNKALSDKAIVSAIGTKPEGFFWWKNGEFDQDKYAEDLSRNIPQLYAAHGYIDAQVVKDTLIVDRVKGKALVRLTVDEGPQYKIGDFEVNGARRFSNDQIATFYPFAANKATAKSLAVTVKPVKRGTAEDKNVFNAVAWQDATDKVKEAYDNEGCIYSSVQPVVERRRVGATRAHGRSALGHRRAHAGHRESRGHRRQRA